MYNMSELPLVSILISLYNKQEYIQQCIDSAINQDYKGKFEVLVCDDCSVDDSYSIACLSKANNIMLMSKNSGTAACRNTLIKASNGVLLQMLDGDDYLEPICLTNRVSCWLKHQLSGLIYSNFRSYVDSKYVQEERGHFDIIDNINEYICGTNIMVSKEVATKVGGYSSEFATIEDWHFSLLVSKIAPIMHIATNDYVYRHSLTQKTQYMLKNNIDKLNNEYYRLNSLKQKLFGM